MKKSINQLIEKFQSLIDMRPVYTNERVFTLWDIYKFTREGIFIFDIPTKEDEDVELLFNQAILSGRIVETYKGYHDDHGNLHITNASNLKLLVEDAMLFNREDNFRLARNFNAATVHIFYLESHGQDSSRRQLVGKALGYPEIK